MQKRSGELPPTKFKAGKGHRSTVSASRFLTGRKKSAIQDALQADADAIMRRLSGKGTNKRADP